MKSEHLSQAIGQVDDDLITAANRSKKKSGKTPWIISLAAIAACVCLFVAISFGKAGPSVAYALTQPAYPEPVQYPQESDYLDETGELDYERYNAQFNAWSEDQVHRRIQGIADYDGLLSFTDATLEQVLSGGEGENRVFSPLNLYFALGMLAECTGGASQKQILDLLHESDIDALRNSIHALWNGNYCDDGRSTSILANSLWLNQGLAYEKETLQRLSDHYYASTYQGEMGSQELNEALQTWLNEQTRGLLKEASDGIKLDADTLLALASTIYFQGHWTDEFIKADTEEGIFHAAGQDQTVTYMRQTANQDYYTGQGFSAVSKGLDTAGSMWLFLPDEGHTVDELLASGQVMSLLTGYDSWEQKKQMAVHLSMPKFDVSSDLDLIDSLKELGVTDVFDAAMSDFSPVIKGTSAEVTQVSHAARVQVDEEGCTAAAFTVIAIEEGAELLQTEEVYFTLERPFLFVITATDGSPLFAGVVNQPVE